MKTRTKRMLIWAAGILGVLVLAAGGGLFWLLCYSDWPGGMRPDYAAADYDSRLTREAENALPIMAALRRFHDKNGNYPAGAAELAHAMQLTVNSGMPSGYVCTGWCYSCYTDGEGYVLNRRLGWDPSLIYDFDGSHGTWIFIPGDGCPEKAGSDTVSGTCQGKVRQMKKKLPITPINLEKPSQALTPEELNQVNRLRSMFKPSSGKLGREKGKNTSFGRMRLPRD